MQPNRLYKLTILLLILPLKVLAQPAPTFVEQNLPTKSINSDSSKQTSAEKQAPTDNIAPLDDGNNINNKNALNAAANKIKDTIGNILLNKKATSLMFDDKQNSNIERALESLKNNQAFVPEGEEGELSEEEQKKKAALTEAEAIKVQQENEKSYIYLASIIYFSPQDWVVWINDKKITSQNNAKDKELFIKYVQRDRVSLTWKISLSKWRILAGRSSEEVPPNLNSNNEVVVHFELLPNQTFILSTNNVVEGKAVIALLKKKKEEEKSKALDKKSPTTDGTKLSPPSANKNIRALTN